MRRCLPVFAAVLLAFARPAPAGTAWVCAMAQTTDRLLCLVDRHPADEAPAPAPLPVRHARLAPADDALVVVPLWAVPTDRRTVELLAQATLCFRQRDCVAYVTPGAWSDALAALEPRAALAPRLVAAPAAFGASPTRSDTGSAARPR